MRSSVNAAVLPRRRACTCTALRRGLPYGAVMATAGAAILARDCGLPFLTAPLLAIAIVWAIALLIAGVRRHRSDFALGWQPWFEVGFADEHSGIHTVPLGVAVVAGGLAELAEAGTARSDLLPLAIAALALAWLLTCVCVARFVWAVAKYRVELPAVDGAWFLVPAAALGSALATLQLTSLLVGDWVVPLQWLALVAGALGALGYVAVAVVAAVRVSRFGLRCVPQAPWWIAMGCAGLAAAALGAVVDASTPGAAMFHMPFVIAMSALEVFAIALWVPVVILGVRFLACTCRFRAAAPWPPTFSTAVFALGGLWAGKVFHSQVFHGIGVVAGVATLAFWLVTVVWNVGVWVRRWRRVAG